MQKRHLLTIILLALASVFSTVAWAEQSFTIDGRNDMRFSKEHIKVEPGEKVTIKLTNHSRLPASAMSHNLVLLKQDVDAEKFDQAAQKAPDNDYIPEDMEDDILAHTRMIGGGHSDEITFTAPKKNGDYEYICTFPGHFQAGMTGKMTVEDE